MATGQKAFSGTSQASLISSILRDEPPPISTVQPMTPPALDRVVQDVSRQGPGGPLAERAHDLGGELKWIAEGGSAGRRSRSRRLATGGSRERLGLDGRGIVLASPSARDGVSVDRARARAVAAYDPHVDPASGRSEFVSSLIDVGPVAVSPDGRSASSSRRETRDGQQSSLGHESSRRPAAHPLAGTEGARRALLVARWPVTSGSSRTDKFKKIEHRRRSGRLRSAPRTDEPRRGPGTAKA